MSIDDTSIRVDTYRVGDGTAMSITHLPTGTVVTLHPDQPMTRQAMRDHLLAELATKLADPPKPKRTKASEETR